MYDLDCLVAAPRIVFCCCWASAFGFSLRLFTSSRLDSNLIPLLALLRVFILFYVAIFFLLCIHFYEWAVFVCAFSSLQLQSSLFAVVVCSMLLVQIYSKAPKRPVICARYHDALPMMVSWWDVKSLRGACYFFSIGAQSIISAGRSSYFLLLSCVVSVFSEFVRLEDGDRGFHLWIGNPIDSQLFSFSAQPAPHSNEGSAPSSFMLKDIRAERGKTLVSRFMDEIDFETDLFASLSSAAAFFCSPPHTNNWIPQRHEKSRRELEMYIESEQENAK